MAPYHSQGKVQPPASSCPRRPPILPLLSAWHLSCLVTSLTWVPGLEVSLLFIPLLQEGRTMVYCSSLCLGVHSL